VILFDASVLLHAYHTRSTVHTACRRFVEDTMSRPVPAALCWQSILAFLRIGTNPRVFAQPLTRREASAIVSAWFGQWAVIVVEPGERFWPILNDLIEAAQVSGPLMTDAALAALAIEHGATLATTDRDFLRFPALKTIDPSI
jgi:uncharacterized protein